MSSTPVYVPPEELARQREAAEAFAALADRPHSFFIVTYGCQMNAHDSEKLAGMLGEMGLTEAPDREQADLVLFNTCCIRDNAERRALGNVIWLKELKKKRPGLLIGVCGCMMQQPELARRLLAQYPFIDFAFGTHNQHRLPTIVANVLTQRRQQVEITNDELLISEGLPVKRLNDYKAYLTIMYGCNNYCSYCIVPYVRGRERSRRMDDILREAEGLLASGVREVMLLGQNVNSYGDSPADFPTLLRRLDALGVPRIRFMTSHPKDLSDELIAAMADCKRVCHHLHLPVQSGSTEILARMNRRYTREHYLARVAALRAAVPDIGLTTDFIVAFPGETEAQFADTLSLAREVRYDAAFTFIYSPRKGTKAAEMPGQILPEIATERIERLIREVEAGTEAVHRSLIGATESVLVEALSRRDERMVSGKGLRNITVSFAGDASDIGRIVPVRITSAAANTLRGERIL